MSSELRKRAEELLRKNPLEVPVLSTVEVQQLLHELDVHQVELQMQNKELLQTQTELARSRDAYAELYDFAPVGYLTLDAENRIHEANFTAAALLGLERGKLPVGRTFAEFIHLDSRPVWEHLRQQLAEHPEKHGADLTLQRADGSLFMARVECAPRLDAAHRLERSFVTLSDVTERVVAQKELFAVFHDAPLPMMVVDRERRVRKINSAALDMARRAEQEALGLRGGEALRCVHAFDDPAGCGFGPDCQACVVRNVVQETFETRQPHHGVEAPIPYSAEGGVIPMWVLVSTAFLDLLGEERVLVCLEDITERKRAEEQLRRSVERLRMAAQAGRFGTYEANLATGEVFWSPEMRAIFGLAADAPPAHKPGTVPSFIHPQDAAEVGEWIRRSYDPSGNGAVEHEHRIVRADGSVRWVLMKGRVTFEGEGDRRRPVRSNGVVMDITARKEIELALKESETKLSLLNLGLERRVAERTAELRESEERFRILFEQAPDAEFLINFDGRFIDGNQAAEQMVGYRREELVGLPMLEFGILDEGSRATAAANLAELAQGEQVPPAEFLVRHKDGTAIPVEISCMTVHIEGRPVVLGSARDLTARKQAERALEESHQLLRSIIDTMHERVWWKDLNSAFLGCNLNVVRDAGLEHPDEIVGKTDYDFCWKQQADRYLADDREVIESGTPKLGILECQTHADGATRWIKTNKIPLHDNEGRIIGTVGTYEDITERKQMQEALEKRIVALTQPLDRPEGITFDDLIDLATIQRIQDDFSNATGVASIITAPDGTPITEPSNFTTLCQEIIRKTETGRGNCMKSDAAIGRHHPGGAIVQQCLGSGLWDAGASIEVGGRHIANWLIGQVCDGTQTEEQMRAYAREIGADEAEFLEAFRHVPVMPREHFEEIAQALFTLANQISTSAYQNVQQARFITARKDAEHALRESEEKYRKVFESESDAIMIFDGETRRFIDVNSAAEKLYGYTREEFLKLAHGAISADPDIAATAIPATLVGQPPPAFASRHRKKDGTVFPVEITGSSFPLKGRQVLCGVIRDISERVARDEEINRNREALRKLAAELSLAEQRERQRIAAELHDGVSQLLSSAALRVGVLQEMPLPEAAAGSLDAIYRILQDSMQQTRSLTFELSCPMLNELGLAAALEELCASLTSEYSIRFKFNGAMKPLPLPMDRKVVLFRCVRELLINVIKHSEAKRAWVQLEQAGRDVRISVEDDGKGFDSAMAGTGFSPSGGFGLFNLREYLHHAGGTLTIESMPGGGTRVAMTVPWEEKHG